MSKEQKQKIFLGILMLIGGIAGIWMGVVKPQITAMKTGKVQQAVLTENITAAKREIATGTMIHSKTVELETIYDTVMKDIPSGAPITWFPPRVSKFFSSMGIPNVSITRGGSGTPVQEGMQNFEELTWSMTAPNAPFMKFGTALAAFETREPLIQITTISILAGAPDTSEFQSVEMGFSLLLPKQVEATSTAPATP